MARVISRMKGGLGNQLFCYAAARRLAIANNAELVIDDVTGFVRDYQYQRKYMLGKFHIPARKATPSERMEPFARYRRGLTKLINRRRPFHQRKYLEQEGIVFDNRLLDFTVNGTVYLDGYWQSELYFRDVADVIRQDLRMIPPQGVSNYVIEQRIRNSEAVCVHFRCYDSPAYNNNKTDIHSNLEMGYYDRAVKKIIKRVVKPHFFIFSDNLQKARNILNLPERDVTIVDHAICDDSAYADFYLMIQCKYFIIANSTFSWWGAWLANQPDKIIIAPNIKLDGLTAWGFKELVPDGWTLL